MARLQGEPARIRGLRDECPEVGILGTLDDALREPAVRRQDHSAIGPSPRAPIFPEARRTPAHPD